MITIKYSVQYESEIDFKSFQNQYNNVLRYAYNRFTEGYTINQTIHCCKELNNIDLLDASWIEFACQKANSIFKTSGSKVIFGGKKNFFKRKYNKITKEEYDSNRNIPVFSIGRMADRGNRKCKINFIENNSIQFCINKDNRIDLKLPDIHNKHHVRLLIKLEELSKAKKEPFTVGFDGENIYISFNETIIKSEEEYIPIKRRILSIDQNPNYTGIVICDYNEENIQTVIHKEVISIKQINDINLKGLPPDDLKRISVNNKRKHEVYETSIHIAKLAKHYKCETVAIEKLSIKSKDNTQGKNFNRIVNNLWNRNQFKNSLTKWCNIFGVKVQEVMPEFSSFIGCISHPSEPDMIAAALEIGRRANLFIRIYVHKDIKQCTIIFPEFDSSSISTHWKKMIENVKGHKTWKSLYYTAKKMKLSYRLSVHQEQFSRLFSKNSLLQINCFH